MKLREDADRVSANLVEALKSIEPAQRAYDAVAQRAFQLTRILAHGPDAAEWSRYFALRPTPEPPLPADEAVEHKRRLERGEEFVEEPVEAEEAA